MPCCAAASCRHHFVDAWRFDSSAPLQHDKLLVRRDALAEGAVRVQVPEPPVQPADGEPAGVAGDGLEAGRQLRQVAAAAAAAIGSRGSRVGSRKLAGQADGFSVQLAAIFAAGGGRSRRPADLAESWV